MLFVFLFYRYFVVLVVTKMVGASLLDGLLYNLFGDGRGRFGANNIDVFNCIFAGRYEEYLSFSNMAYFWRKRAYRSDTLMLIRLHDGGWCAGDYDIKGFCWNTSITTCKPCTGSLDWIAWRPRFLQRLLRLLRPIRGFGWWFQCYALCDPFQFFIQVLFSHCIGDDFSLLYICLVGIWFVPTRER